MKSFTTLAALSAVFVLSACTNTETAKPLPTDKPVVKPIEIKTTPVEANKPGDDTLMLAYKPVIYLYPEAPQEVSVKVYPNGGFTKTEPEYGDGWRVYTDTESNIYDYKTQKKYPYLFWEGLGVGYEMPEKGFVVAQQDVPTELPQMLSKLGMNDKEIADFMEYWGPQFDTDYPYYFITFIEKEVFDKYAPLEIEPEPDTIIRVFMDHKGLSGYQEVEPLELSAPARTGFTVVEWGGTVSQGE